MFNSACPSFLFYYPSHENETPASFFKDWGKGGINFHFQLLDSVPQNFFFSLSALPTSKLERLHFERLDHFLNAKHCCYPQSGCSNIRLEC
jgi:hypothetical protein